MTAIEYLDQQVKLLIPRAEGVSIGRWNDKSTWRVFAHDLTTQEVSSLTDLFATFDKTQYDSVQVAPKTLEQRVLDIEANFAVLESKAL